MTASVGLMMVGSSRSSTRMSPGACRTAPRMVFLLGVDVGGSVLGESENRQEEQVQVTARGGAQVVASGCSARLAMNPVKAATARATEMLVTMPSGSTVAAPATPTRGAVTPPKAKRAMPSSEDAVPAIRG